MTPTPYALSLIVAAVVSLIILLLALSIVVAIWRGEVNLAFLLSEPIDKGGDGKPKASLSRFQFLIFTFVIAGLYLVLSIESGQLIEVPPGALVLLGISGGSYLISKAAGKRLDQGQTPNPNPDANANPNANQNPG
jgi:hypothetical protein